MNAPRSRLRALLRGLGAPAAPADQLTGLASRQRLLDHLAEVVRRGRRASVLYLDLDDFKLVNDTLGHGAGDELLRHVTSAMKPLVAPGDLLARQGGDELVLVAVGDVDDAAIAARLRDVITRPVSLLGIEVTVGVSIGIARFPDVGRDPTTLIEVADHAMYEAKQSGRNQIRWGSAGDVHSDGHDRAAIELTTTLPQAIARDELILHWQPLVDIEDLSIVGLEALVRWNHPERGLLQPVAFVPFAERTGLISAVDEWVASSVARQRIAWQAQGLDPYVGFNLAPQFARRPDALVRLLERLREGGLSLDHITVELTESQALREDHRLLAFVHGLNDAGVTVSLDDFGQAYSSLNRLREVPARWIKLDRAFLHNVPEDAAATEVLTAIVGLLRALRFEFIVEGVEHESQRRVLVDMGVRLAQGFLLGRPVPAEQLHDRMLGSPACRLVAVGAAA